MSAGTRHEAARAAGMMAAVSVNTRGVMTESGRGKERGGRDGWKRDIVRQLKHRDQNQHAMFTDLIRFSFHNKRSPQEVMMLESGVDDEASSRQKKFWFWVSLRDLDTASQSACEQRETSSRSPVVSVSPGDTHLLDKTSLAKGILSCSARRPSADSSSITTLLHRNNQLKKTTGELAYQVVELQQKIKIKECFLEEQHARLSEDERRAGAASDARQELQQRVEQVQGENGALKMEYDALLERQRGAETRLREENLRGGHLLEEIMHMKKQAATRMNSRNERKSSRKRRGHSVCSLEEDLMTPVGICLYARVPVRACQVLEAHEQGINAVRFSSSSDLLATGGTDRVIKLWEVRSGSLTHRATLDGSTEGITCVEFDATCRRILAASYDKSALLWRLDDPVPKLTLTGHSRKVTAARFSSFPHQVVTGSADRTIRLWDLQRAACVQVTEVASSCSDLVCPENCIISGHFDSKIRVWDTRTVNCVQQLPAQGKVTSLDVSADHRQLLSCCRDDCLQLVDLRRWSSNNRMCFRADGFKCGSDSTKAVIRWLFSSRSGSADGAVYHLNVSTGNLETRLPDQHSSSISAVSWSLSGEYVVSVDKSRLAVLWSDI
ncbi:Autophagy-related protein 16-2 [Nibea albiflora]|uniref:Autophagy-related protein 16-2 n=1 Tax=Nibea albiflora TaxID=240163 RepID=A0ACB7EJA5_NIBAL|nr:Autophagy-related protein 16-2 [Nibea albiflora]